MCVLCIRLSKQSMNYLYSNALFSNLYFLNLFLSLLEMLISFLIVKIQSMSYLLCTLLNTFCSQSTNRSITFEVLLTRIIIFLITTFRRNDNYY